MEQSPFLTHRHILLNDYGAAITLRVLTLSLWNGRNWPADMSRVAGLDNQHFAIAQALLAWYRQHGENDPEFMKAGAACEAMALEARRQAEQQQAYAGWEQLVERELGSRGQRSDLAFDRYEWFFARYQQGLTPAQAAEQAISQGLQ